MHPLLFVALASVVAAIAGTWYAMPASASVETLKVYLSIAAVMGVVASVAFQYGRTLGRPKPGQ